MRKVVHKSAAIATNTFALFIREFDRLHVAFVAHRSPKTAICSVTSNEFTRNACAIRIDVPSATMSLFCQSIYAFIRSLCTPMCASRARLAATRLRQRSAILLTPISNDIMPSLTDTSYTPSPSSPPPQPQLRSVALESNAVDAFVDSPHSSTSNITCLTNI